MSSRAAPDSTSELRTQCKAAFVAESKRAQSSALQQDVSRGVKEVFWKMQLEQSEVTVDLKQYEVVDDVVLPCGLSADMLIGRCLRPTGKTVFKTALLRNLDYVVVQVTHREWNTGGAGATQPHEEQAQPPPLPTRKIWLTKKLEGVFRQISYEKGKSVSRHVDQPMCQLPPPNHHGHHHRRRRNIKHSHSHTPAQ